MTTKFRVSPVMTASIPLRIRFCSVLNDTLGYYITNKIKIQVLWRIFLHKLKKCKNRGFYTNSPLTFSCFYATIISNG